MRTPLTSIIGYVEMAREEAKEAPGLATYLAVIQRNSKRLLGLVNDLLDAASGRLEIRRERVDLSQVLQRALESQQPRASAAGLTVDGSIDEGLVVEGDELRLGQVVDNLLSNAIKYTPSGGTVSLNAYRIHDQVVFTVGDTGIGMSPDELDRLFVRFYRTSSVRKTAIGGAGLGLAIAKELVEAHGGSIEARSWPAQGTDMTVTLPVARNLTRAAHSCRGFAERGS
ncbi:HAMP domain-containing sensor histidine kinase [Zafaria sp. J156]|nr:HAMP domain-containing sensor histidine kinase [Zafaria sp. J156]MEE1620512.1 HAMP domain-containing sensor histidine kinase [Zafaria sp. J156]